MYLQVNLRDIFFCLLRKKNFTQALYINIYFWLTSIFIENIYFRDFYVIIKLPRVK